MLCAWREKKIPTNNLNFSRQGGHAYTASKITSTSGQSQSRILCAVKNENIDINAK